jgi:hypothetical protein
MTRTQKQIQVQRTVSMKNNQILRTTKEIRQNGIRVDSAVVGYRLSNTEEPNFLLLHHVMFLITLDFDQFNIIFYV